MPLVVAFHEQSRGRREIRGLRSATSGCRHSVQLVRVCALRAYDESGWGKLAQVACKLICDSTRVSHLTAEIGVAVNGHSPTTCGVRLYEQELLRFSKSNVEFQTGLGLN